MSAISREAAIKLILSGRVGDDSRFECPAECNSMLEWAAAEVAKMPAAEQEPLREKMKTEKAIERIKAFRDYLCAGNPIWDVGECKEAFDIAIAAMEQRWMPTADVPDRKVGKWILYDIQDKEESANGNFYYVCSCCGKGDTHAKGAKVPYCWWCGARMKGEEDDGIRKT